jgi:helix-turn-helix protein
MQTSSPEIELAAKLGAITNLVHGFIYFSPEATEEYTSVGLSKDQHYFASRASALGAVSAEVVVATFFNFNPEMVYPAIPAAWDAASPEAVQSARMRAAARTLDRCCPALDGD